METYIESNEFVDNHVYHKQRRNSFNKLDLDSIDPPLIDIINGFSKLHHCFTIQSCCGHFLYNGQSDPKNVEPLPVSDTVTVVEYRIAYIALCLQDSDMGRGIFRKLKTIARIDPEYIQFGCAEWFWERQVNSYIVQVEPDKYKMKDLINVSYQEALHIEKIRNLFVEELKGIFQK